ncbi:MAG: Mut7-C ubiquitin/RNAse domain-containing protein [Candidatus Bipolaricaulota bacterium]|nr:MAG: Mut7-C ubiquitin/RNAse domain-containing protein [Candidatus Bipolaricaulota bacterium]
MPEAGAASQATFRFYAELNDFLPEGNRQSELIHAFIGSPRVKDAIESFGVPHVEVDLILANGISVDFDYRLGADDRIAVYPVFESVNVSPAVRLQGRPLRRTAFLLDVHLRRLARWLRLLGFDASCPRDEDDARLARRSVDEGRILLTRDRELLKRGELTHGYWVRATDPRRQIVEILRRFDLVGDERPFTRCPTCNGLLAEVPKGEVLERIPPRTAAWLDRYVRCSSCDKLFWQGTHHARLGRAIAEVLAEAGAAGPGADQRS